MSPEPDETERDPSAFFERLGALLDAAGQLFERRAELQPERASLYRAACIPVVGVRPEIDRLATAAVENEEVATVLSRVLAETGAAPLMNALANAGPIATRDGGGGDEGTSVNDALDLGKDFLDKAKAYLPPPFDGAAENIGQVIGIVGKLAGDKSAELEKLEALEGVIDAIKQEVEKIEGKAERLGELTGVPVVDDGGTVVDPQGEDGYGQPEIPGSLLWMVWQNQFKLEHLWRKTYGDDYPGSDDTWIEEPPPLDGLRRGDAWLRDNGGQIGRLAFKIDKLADLLGKAIVDAKAKWDPEPPIHGGGTITAEEAALINKLPEKSVKEELHDIEDLLGGLRRLLILWIDIDILDVDIDIDVFVTIINNYFSTVLEQHAVKRIYVYEEGVFEAQSARDRKRIAIRTPAFDLAGWIDLDDLRVGDEVRIEMHVILPTGSGRRTRRRLYKRVDFSAQGVAGRRPPRSPDGRGLKSLQDIFGPSIIVGKAIDITIIQRASANGFPSDLEIGYQLVVESNDAPPPRQ